MQIRKAVELAYESDVYMSDNTDGANKDSASNTDNTLENAAIKAEEEKERKEREEEDNATAVCCVCMSPSDDNDRLRRYCAQCNAEVHSACMLQMLNHPLHASTKQPVPVVEHYRERGAIRPILFPPGTHLVLQMILCKTLFSDDDTLVSVQTLRANSDDLQSYMRVERFLACEFDSVAFNIVPTAKCAQCRFTTAFTQTCTVPVRRGVIDERKSTTMWLYVCFVLHLFAASYLTLYLHRVLTSMIGIWSFLLPLTPYLYQLSCCVVSAPLTLLLWPTFCDELFSACFDQRKIARVPKNEFRRIASQIHAENAQSDVLRLLQVLPKSKLVAHLLETCFPSSLITLFATVAGFSILQLFTSGTCMILQADASNARATQSDLVYVCRTPTAERQGIRGADAANSEEKSDLNATAANSDEKRDLGTIELVHRRSLSTRSSAAAPENAVLTSSLERIVSGIVFIFTSATNSGVFGGPSLATTFVVYALTNNSTLLWYIYAAAVLFETVRISIYAWIAWRWLPRHWPAFCLTRTNAPDVKNGWRLTPRVF